MDYPATISTLFRTGDKFRSIVASPDEEEPDSNCLLCGSRIEEAPVCSAYSARMMSQSVSRSGPHQLAPDTFNLGNTTAACNGEKDSCKSKGLAKTCCKSIDGPLSIEDWNPTLCYGCRVTLQDVVLYMLRFLSLHYSLPFIYVFFFWVGWIFKI